MEERLTPFKITTGVWMVPCRVGPGNSKYIPVSKPPSNLKKLENPNSRQSWSEEETSALKEIILKNGPRHWSSISAYLNDKAHGGHKLRTGKQCRERWYGHLNPVISQSEWTYEEDLVLVQKQAILGNKWSGISKALPGRTENQIKNRWKRLEKYVRMNLQEGIEMFYSALAEENFAGCFSEEIESFSAGNDLSFLAGV